jgi:hypothetical protein
MCWRKVALWKPAAMLEQLGLYYAMWRQQVGERDLDEFMPAYVQQVLEPELDIDLDL